MESVLIKGGGGGGGGVKRPKNVPEVSFVTLAPMQTTITDMLPGILCGVACYTSTH